MIPSSSLYTLQQLHDLVEQLTEAEFSGRLSILSGSSIGMHLRHILEFYECLFEGLQTGTVNYEKRRRNLRLENEKTFALQALQDLCQRLLAGTRDVLLQLEVEEGETISTTFQRELVYNTEHCIHHMALLRIGLESCCPQVRLPEDFGVAPSTVRHRQSVSQ
jgi:uncharacterized damage-inducible protein DinB